MTPSNNLKTSKRLTAGIALIIVLSLCLCLTTFALVYSTVVLENNLFGTGKVEINLNGGEAIISENEFIFEPGMTVKKGFFLENNSTHSVYYKIYLDKVAGDLKDVLIITISSEDKELYSGTAAELSDRLLPAADDILEIGEHKELMMSFHFPTIKGNSVKDKTLTFSTHAQAVQTKNNPQKIFN